LVLSAERKKGGREFARLQRSELQAARPSELEEDGRVLGWAKTDPQLCYISARARSVCPDSKSLNKNGNSSLKSEST